jgi:hypothetical protein
MLDKSAAEAAIYRTAYAAFTYYPEKHLDEPGYTVIEDLDWCLEPLAVLAEALRGPLRGWMHDVITNPDADRQGLIRAVRGLADA